MERCTRCIFLLLIDRCYFQFCTRAKLLLHSFLRNSTQILKNLKRFIILPWGIVASWNSSLQYRSFIKNLRRQLKMNTSQGVSTGFWNTTIIFHTFVTIHEPKLICKWVLFQSLTALHPIHRWPRNWRHFRFYNVNKAIACHTYAVANFFLLTACSSPFNRKPL